MHPLRPISTATTQLAIISCPCTDPLCCALYIVAFMFSWKIWISWCRGSGGSLWNVFWCEWSISCGLRCTVTGSCPLFSVNVSSFLSPHALPAHCDKLMGLSLSLHGEVPRSQGSVCFSVHADYWLSNSFRKILLQILKVTTFNHSGIQF